MPFGGVDPLYAMGSDGLLHTLRVEQRRGPGAAGAVPAAERAAVGADLRRRRGLHDARRTTAARRRTRCGRSISRRRERKPRVWKTGGANVAGTTGPAFGTDGTSTSRWARTRRGPTAGAGQATRRTPTPSSRSIGHTLRRRTGSRAPGADFNASPIVIRDKDRDLIAATGNDGRLYLLDGASARRRRSQDAALRDAEVHRRRRRRRARDLGERRHALDPRARRRRRRPPRSSRPTASRRTARSSRSSWSTRAAS